MRCCKIWAFNYEIEIGLLVRCESVWVWFKQLIDIKWALHRGWRSSCGKPGLKHLRGSSHFSRTRLPLD